MNQKEKIKPLLLKLKELNLYRNTERQIDAVLIELLKAIEDPWTPCAVALPEKDGWYLVTLLNKRYEKVERETRKLFWDNEDRAWNINNPSPWMKDILAWCEIPEPWEGGE